MTSPPADPHPPVSPRPAPIAISLLRWEDPGPARPADDFLAPEEPLEIRIDTRPVSVTLRTPGHDADLALGFLLSEGLVQSADQVRRLQPHPGNPLGNVLDVQLQPDVIVDIGRLQRHVFTSSSCGLCGVASLERVHRQFPPLPPPASPPEPRMDPRTLLSLPDRMRAAQAEFGRTGGLHAAALFDFRGTLRLLREDVGRHNAVDKILGAACRNGWLPLDNQILLVSGRLSFELVQKALAGRIPIVAAVSAPSSLAVALARSAHLTLAGFLRPGRFNVYSEPGRIQSLTPPPDGTGAAPGPVSQV